jgi:hypothetical protein
MFIIFWTFSTNFFAPDISLQNIFINIKTQTWRELANHVEGHYCRVQVVVDIQVP